MKKMIIMAIILVIVLATLFYFYIPIKNSPLTGGPVDGNNPARKPNKVSFYEYFKLKKAIIDNDLIE